MRLNFKDVTKKLQALQKSDLNQIVSKFDKGKISFKTYKPERSKEVVEGGENETSRPISPEEPLATEQFPYNNIYFYHPDHLGTGTYLTDANGLPYQFFLNLPFGETMVEMHSNTENYASPYKFNGKELDAETGLYYYGARYYNPKISIWLSVDPLAEKYPNFNPYNYTLQNPIRFIDPTGMAAKDSDGWIKTTNSDGKATYTYDATINSQTDVNEHFPNSGKEYMGENFSLKGRKQGSREVVYNYNFNGTQVTDSNGNSVDLSNNMTTTGGSTIMNPQNTGGTFTGISFGGAVGGGLSLGVGFVTDKFGDRGLYFTFSGNSGFGGGVGITSGVIEPTAGQTFGINDYGGFGNSISGGVGYDPVGLGGEYGGTAGRDGNGFMSMGTKHEKNARPYIYYGGSQSSHYPSIGIPVGKVSLGGMISSSRTWVFKL